MLASLTCVAHDQNETLRSCLGTPAASLCWFSPQISVLLASHLCCVTPLDFNAASLVHQPCGQDADDENEHRIKYDEPDRRISGGRPMRCESYLCLHILSSAEPESIKNTQDRERQAAPNEDNSFEAIVPNDRRVVHDFPIATKQLIAPPVDENANAQGNKQRNGKCDAQRRHAGRFDGEKKSERVHVELS